MHWAELALPFPGSQAGSISAGQSQDSSWAPASQAFGLGPVFCWCPGWSTEVLTFDSILSLSHTHTHKHTYMPPTPLHQGSPCSQEKVTRGIEEAQTHKGSGFLRSLNFRVWFTTSSYPHFIEPGRRRWPKSQEWNSRDCERDRAGLEPVGSMGCSCSLSWVCGRLLGWPVGWGGVVCCKPHPSLAQAHLGLHPRLPEVPGFLHTQAGPPCHGPSLAMVTSMQRLSGPQTLIEDARKE